MNSVFRLIFCVLLALAASLSAFAADPASPAQLSVFNREVFTFRADFLGASPAIRAARARNNISEILSNGKAPEIVIQEHPDGKLVMLDNTAVFVITKGDIDPLDPITFDELGSKTLRLLTQVIGETNEARNWESLLKALGIVRLADKPASKN